MKLSKELKAGIVTLLAILLLVTGVNFLKGNSFFGGDDQYEAYFPNSGNLAPATSVYVNGVAVGKVLKVEYQGQEDSLSKVKVTFNIQNRDVKIPRGSVVQIGSVDPLTKGIILHLSEVGRGNYRPGERIQGTVDPDLITQLKSYVDPVIQKFHTLASSVDRTINTINSFWDTTAATSIEASMNEIKIAIKRFGNVAAEVETMVASEKAKFGRIMSNVESISNNLKASNEKIAGIIGNTKKITDDLMTVNYKAVVEDAQKTIQKLNQTMDEINSGKGSLGKLLHDEKLYNELVNTNKEVQELLEDIQLHPERYIHFSVLGAKTKGVPLTGQEEKRLRKLLDSIPD